MKVVSIRLDRWLWAARFYKTRTRAVNAVKRSRIKLNGRGAKPASRVAIGDQLHIRKAQFIYEIQVASLSDKRLSAKLAQALYLEPQTSIDRRALRQQQLRSNRQHLIDGRPSKKDRRLQRAAKRGRGLAK